MAVPSNYGYENVSPLGGYIVASPMPKLPRVPKVVEKKQSSCSGRGSGRVVVDQSHCRSQPCSKNAWIHHRINVMKHYYGVNNSYFESSD